MTPRGRDRRPALHPALRDGAAERLGDVASARSPRAAITALNRGAAKGGFAHDTGEGGLTDHHLQGADIVWEIGTGYFGARTKDGGFDEQKFAEKAANAARQAASR